MKSILILYLLFALTLSTELNAQTQPIDPDIAEILKKVSSSSEFIRSINYYLTVQRVEELDKKAFKEYLKISKIVNKNDIPIYKINSSSMMMDFYFKKGRMVYNFSLEKKNDLYFSHVKLYTFKKRRIKKQGAMAFRP